VIYVTGRLLSKRVFFVHIYAWHDGAIWEEALDSDWRFVLDNAIVSLEARLE
jgi:hypothetical protein